MLKFLKVVFAVFAASITFFAFQTTTQAKSDEAYDDIEEAALAPDSPFYFLRNWQETVETFITNFQDEEAKANLEMEFAQRRLSEMKRLARLGADGEIIERLQTRWQEHINRMRELAEKITTRREEAKTRFLEQIDRHRAVMEKVREQVPDEAKDSIDRAIKNYETARQKLLENFSGSKLDEIKSRLKERLDGTVERFRLNRERFKNLLENRSETAE
ncbi:hypothetical protein A2797_01570 [candidate division WWE3 bacterium RIFCSPHIGHO2_01_FULL_48_15]|uniref:DUF5667 domain-containing protein n=1 Tax=candidate division WWE3 bacterium RIFCSPHIGHO2_01_FULL_48_15 TaxID=1802619 RepID=A0A1F4VBG1_UNCKA|nr:MAG: hypothetical protein A2797_01570 [candidate division WWE3 bacterium RIFCSPHIGHO2_01_FULL_48_15]